MNLNDIVTVKFSYVLIRYFTCNVFYMFRLRQE